MTQASRNFPPLSLCWNIWLYQWFPNHSMPKGTECEITPSRECLSRGSAPSSPSHSSSIIAFQACIGKSPKQCYVWREQNALEISWNPKLCPNWDHCGITKPLFSSLQLKQTIFSILTRSLHKSSGYLSLMFRAVRVIKLQNGTKHRQTSHTHAQVYTHTQRPADFTNPVSSHKMTTESLAITA